MGISEDMFRRRSALGSAALEKAFDDGVAQGRNDERKALLRWLEAEYIDKPDRPDRGSPKGEAILQLAREAMEHFQEKR